MKIVVLSHLLILVSLASHARARSTDKVETAAEHCAEYGFSEEKYGHFGQVDLSLQHGECGGAGHNQYAVSLVARDPKTHDIIDFYDDEGMGDGDVYSNQNYARGVFVFGDRRHAQVVRFDKQTKKFVKAFEQFGDDHEQKAPEIKPIDLVGTSFEGSLKKIAKVRANDCHDIDRIGEVLSIDLVVYEAAQLLGAHREADRLYKAGQKKEAADIVIRYLGQPGSEGFDFWPEFPYSEIKSVEGLETGAPEQEEALYKLRYFTPKINSDETESEEKSQTYVREWNDLAFYLLQAGYAKPARTILQWVTNVDPQRKVAAKNLEQVNQMTSSKSVVFDLENFSDDPKSTIQALETFRKKNGGTFVWTYGNLKPVFKSKKIQGFALDSKGCQQEFEGGTLLDLALALGEIEVADYLWAHGFKNASLDARELWSAALKAKQSDSALWLADAKIGLDDPAVLELIGEKDNVNAYNIWAQHAPNAKALTEKRLYSRGFEGSILDNLLEKNLVSKISSDREAPTILFVLARSYLKINNRDKKLKQMIAAGVSPNVLNAERLSALDKVVQYAEPTNLAVAKTADVLRSLGAKPGADLMAKGKRPAYEVTAFPKSALSAFKRAQSPPVVRENQNLVFQCDTGRVFARVARQSDDTYELQYGHIMNRKAEIPNVDLTQKGVVTSEGTGNCATTYYKFKSAKTEYLMAANIACAASHPPSNAIGSLSVKTNGKEVERGWCYHESD